MSYRIFDYFRVLCVVVLLWFGVGARAQTVQETPIRFKDTIWYDKGFDFYISGGMFMANKYNANYYNGSVHNECNLHYIFDNSYWYDDICNEVVEEYSYISATDSIYYQEKNLPQQMHYKIKTGISLGVRYKITDGLAVALSYSFSRLTAKDQFLLDYTSISGNQYDNPVMYLSAKEDRSLFDLSISYLFHLQSIVRPFIEMGVQFNYVNVKEFKAKIGDLDLTLLDPYGGESYVPGAQMNTYNTKYGGSGFGFSAAAGVKFIFNKSISLDPTFYLSASKLGLPGYRKFALNYGAYIRVVMSDFFFGK